MLLIRKQQMEALSAHLLAQYKQRLLAHLRRDFPRQTRDSSDEQLRELVNNGIARAESYGITGEDDVQQYVDRTLLYGVDFDTQAQTAWAGAILRDATLTGTQKISRICNHEVFVLRAAP